MNKRHSHHIDPDNAKTKEDFRLYTNYTMLCLLQNNLQASNKKMLTYPVRADFKESVSFCTIYRGGISVSVLITHEVMYFLKMSLASKWCLMSVKTDMSQAYDRLEWNFVGMVLKRLDFHWKWINWIMQCVRTASFSFLVIWSAKEMVIPSREIIQGDPFSFYLFIFYSEALWGYA